MMADALAKEAAFFSIGTNDLTLLADGNRIVWIPGYRISAYYKVTPETKNIIRINYKNKE